MFKSPENSEFYPDPYNIGFKIPRAIPPRSEGSFAVSEAVRIIQEARAVSKPKVVTYDLRVEDGRTRFVVVDPNAPKPGLIKRLLNKFF